MRFGRKLVAALLAALSIGVSASAAPRSDAEQIGVLAETATGSGGWFVSPSQDGEWSHWFYTVTDLNHDGRLELFKVKRRDLDSAPWLQCEELNDNGKGRHYGIFFAGGTDVPDILSTESGGQPSVLYDASENRYYYIFDDCVVMNEFASKTTRYALDLGGDLHVEELGFMMRQESGLDGSLSFRAYLPAWHGVEAESNTPLPEPKEISMERYAGIAAERFPGCEKRGVLLQWVRAEQLQKALDSGNAADVLAEAYAFFHGDKG